MRPHQQTCRASCSQRILGQGIIIIILLINSKAHNERSRWMCLGFLTVADASTRVEYTSLLPGFDCASTEDNVVDVFSVTSRGVVLPDWLCSLSASLISVT